MSAVVALAESQDAAFAEFRCLVAERPLTSLAVPLEADLGDYVHILDPENPDYHDRLARVTWLRPTLNAPEEIWHLLLRRTGRVPLPRVYFLRQLQTSTDEAPEWFVVVTQPTEHGLRLKTWFVADEDYLDDYIRIAGERL